MKKRIQKITLISMLFLSSCAPEFLEIKTDAGIGTPYKLADFQAVLDNSTGFMNVYSSHELAFMGSDEFTSPSSLWHQYIPLVHKNAYIWSDDTFVGLGNSSVDWNKGYERILYCNMVLDGIEKIQISADENLAKQNVKGSALFYRALTFYQLVQLFANVYEEETADVELGLPLRLDSDVTLKSQRATLRETYERIILDLEESILILPERPVHKFRPSKTASYALLSKLYLNMENYEKAEEYVDLALGLADDLYDFNTVSTDLMFSFPVDYGMSNPEVIFFANCNVAGVLDRNIMDVSEDLLGLYEATDLRKIILFQKNHDIGNVYFKGSYYGDSRFFTGLTTSELMLIKSECANRRGDLEQALYFLNKLRKNRFSPTEYLPVENLNQTDMLAFIIEERRRELAFKGVRWEDLRRFNKDVRFAKDIHRVVDGKDYILKANSKYYTWLIPSDVINISGIAQNKR